MKGLKYFTNPKSRYEVSTCRSGYLPWVQCCLLCKCLKYPSLHASDLLISQDTVHIILSDDISDDDDDDDDVGVPVLHL